MDSHKSIWLVLGFFLSACNSGPTEAQQTETLESLVRTAESELFVTITFKALVRDSMNEILTEEQATIIAGYTATFTPEPTLTETLIASETPTIRPSPTFTIPPTFTQAPTIPPTEDRTGCHPAYPDPGVCIPPPPPDLNCPDIPYKRFTVLPPDPHGFDGNGDGVGCES